MEDVDTPSQMYIQAFIQIYSPLYARMMIIHCFWLHTQTRTVRQSAVGQTGGGGRSWPPVCV